MPRSPKGLIANRSVAPEEMAQLGMHLEQIGCLDVDLKIKNFLAYYRRFAGSHIEANPATNGTLDRTAAAKAILTKLYTYRILPCRGRAQCRKRNLYVAALYQAVPLVSDIHQLAIIDNETAIVARQLSIEGGRRRADFRSAELNNSKSQNGARIPQAPWRKDEQFALMADIGAAKCLKRRASINAVKSGLKKLTPRINRMVRARPADAAFVIQAI